MGIGYSVKKKSQIFHLSISPGFPSCTIHWRLQSFAGIRKMAFRISVTLFTRTVVGPRSWPTFRTRALHTVSPGVLSEDMRAIMRKVPQPVVVVTTSHPTEPRHRRGITVSSFTSICFHPEPLVSFCVRIPSRASDLLHSSGNMIVNMLSHEQVQQSIAFSSPTADQFKDVPFYDDSSSGLPVLMGTLGSMHCQKYQVLELGDHELWITKVLKVEQGVGSTLGTRQEAQPLLYYDRGYRSVGDQVFMKALEDSTLDTRLWMHRAHIRMAWNYLRDQPRDQAEPLIKKIIHSHFEKNPTTKQKYHETITSFYIGLIDLAMQSHQMNDLKDQDDFFDFMEKFPVLTDPRTIQSYYSPQLLSSDQARREFVPPDLKPFPTTVPSIQEIQPEKQ
ncbi:flavin reductase like domain-containing protein [Radiomyces spectabilis]|uniref:flavin reductase like domain-containing protein n=1 Tax=Radiomyces spectabilis TaxID=64574 RepID=UPI00221F5F64|nr:flavin reductase like domain-containing protein [Radiomyces spectabilis]KAI8374636.1 flavin reductase like domain-containing protein [Radiomyces spectabilis]